MSSHRSWGPLAVIATVLALAVVTAGCGRRGIPAAAGFADATASQAVTTAEPTNGPTIDGSMRPPSAAAPEPRPAPTPVTPVPVASRTPLAIPDLTAIDNLLDELDAALGADATADTDEGSPR